MLSSDTETQYSISLYLSAFYHVKHCRKALHKYQELESDLSANRILRNSFVFYVNYLACGVL